MQFWVVSSGSQNEGPLDIKLVTFGEILTIQTNEWSEFPIIVICSFGINATILLK